jgi:predicted metal-binding protein
MNKIGIINCYNESRECSSFGCFKAFNDREASFKNYDCNSEIICFAHCNGCSENSVNQVLDRARIMKKKGVDTIHLSTCIKLKCSLYNKIIESLGNEIDIVGYSHDVE